MKIGLRDFALLRESNNSIQLTFRRHLGQEAAAFTCPPGGAMKTLCESGPYSRPGLGIYRLPREHDPVEPQASG